MLRYALENPSLCGPRGRRCDWVMWMDADSWFHPSMLDVAVDSWLHDVPEDRFLVLGNRVALNTGVLMLRGRHGFDNSIGLLDEWSSVSHLIHCHAFDQAALQLIVLRSIRRQQGDGPNTGTADSPFGFTCEQPFCSQNLTKKPYWSCNLIFDAVLSKSGWGGLLR